MASRKIKVARGAAAKGAKGWVALRLVERLASPRGGARSRTTLIVTGAAAGAAGAGTAYLLDPQNGRRRRHVARDRALRVLRRGRDEAARKADHAAGQVKGAAHEAREKASGESPKAELTDQALARKVESIIFRDESVPKSRINVDAAGRSVSLRGEVYEEDQLNEIVRRTQEIPEVERVENLLHLPGQAAPTRADTPAEQRVS